jgi:EKC/KEOPS complex subunit CGI121/TPRKB
MKATKFPQFEGYSVLITLFDNVTNSSDINSQLNSGNPDYEYAFISARTVLSTDHLKMAIYQALNDTLTNNNLRTRNIHSEIVLCMSPNNNIIEGLRKFGINDQDKAIFAIKVVKDDDNADKYYEFLKQAIEGDEVDVSNAVIFQLNDPALIKKVSINNFIEIDVFR